VGLGKSQKMKKSYFLPVFSVLLFFFASCTQPRQLVYQDVKNFRVGDLNFSQPKLGMDLQFYNPNNFGLTLKDANINIYLNNTFIGSAVLNNQFDVPGLDTFLMPIMLTADLKNIFPNALQILFNKEVDLRIQGNVKAGKGVFLNVPINFQGKRRLNVF
jgi:LEA14-like dessication related protein